VQIVFNEISAAEISKLDTLDQMDLLDDFKVTEGDLNQLEEGGEGIFGKIEREGKTLYRFRSKDWRIYFETGAEQVIVHRILHKNSFSDFLFRAKLPLSEDQELAESKHFWALIDEGRNAKRI